MKSDDLLKEARERFDIAYTAEQENRERGVEDLRFLDGDQWPEEIRRQREVDQRPCLTINRLPTYSDQIIGNARQNRPGIKIRPAGDDPPDGMIESDGVIQTVKLSEIYEGLVRHIEYVSDAESAYDTALESSVQCGRGAFRILTEYSDDDAFDQDILIKRIPNPFTVYIDPFYTESDASDAQWLFVTEMIPKKEFEQRYPKANSVSELQSGIGDSAGWDGWITADSVRVAEYWKKVQVIKEIVLMPDGSVINGSDFDKLKQIDPTIQEIKRRTVKSHKVVYYLINGNEILEGGEDGKPWMGKYIPVCMVFGKELNIENRRVYRSAIRNAKDAQRLNNYWTSSIAENIALAPKAPYLVTARQVEGFEDQWRSMNVTPSPYLLYNPDSQAPGAPQRQPLTAIDSALITERLQSIDDIKQTTGIFDASLGRQGNETSGRAIVARQKQGDNTTFVFPDNLNRAVRLCGKILIDLIPRIYDTARVVRVRMATGEERTVKINHTVFDPATGQELIINDLSQGKYDVVVTTGQAYATQRLEAADSMLQFVQAVPGSGQFIADLIADSMDWPKADIIAERLRRVIPPQVLGPEEQQTEQQQASMPGMGIPPGEPGGPPGGTPEMPPEVQLKLAQEQAKLEGLQLENELKKVKLMQAMQPTVAPDQSMMNGDMTNG